MQIIVLGMHRSGTSLTTRIINMMGAYFAPEGMSLGFAEDNPKGFWERRDVLKINQHLLKHFNCTWFKVDTWDDARLHTIPPIAMNGIKSLVLEMDAHRPWVVKDPRFCITLPCWKVFMEVPVAVIAWRDPLEIARSLEIRNGMPIPYGLALWEYHVVHLIRHSVNMPKVFSHHETLISKPVEATRTLYEGLTAAGVQGLRIPSDREILAFIEAKLYRARKEAVNHTLSEHQEKLSAMLRGEVPFDPDIDISQEAHAITEEAKKSAFLRRVS